MNEHIRKITHVTIKSKRFSEAVEFYENVLELDKKFTLDYDEGLVERMEQTGFVQAGDPWISYFKISDREFIELFNQNYKDEDHIGDYSYAYVTFKVGDLKKTAETIAGKGVELYKDEFGTEAINAEAVSGYFFVKDPDENAIMYIQA